MFGYFENRKTSYFYMFYVLCLNFSIEIKIKTLFLISYYNLSKKRNGTLGTRLPCCNLLMTAFASLPEV